MVALRPPRFITHPTLAPSCRCHPAVSPPSWKIPPASLLCLSPFLKPCHKNARWSVCAHTPSACRPSLPSNATSAEFFTTTLCTRRRPARGGEIRRKIPTFPHNHARLCTPSGFITDQTALHSASLSSKSSRSKPVHRSQQSRSILLRIKKNALKHVIIREINVNSFLISPMSHRHIPKSLRTDSPKVWLSLLYVCIDTCLHMRV